MFTPRKVRTLYFNTPAAARNWPNKQSGDAGMLPFLVQRPGQQTDFSLPFFISFIFFPYVLQFGLIESSRQTQTQPDAEVSVM